MNPTLPEYSDAVIEAGYSIVVLILAALLMVVALVRPRQVGWLSLFLLMMTDQIAYTFTRISQLGSAINLFDVLLANALISTLWFRLRQKIQWPPLFAAVNLVLMAGMVITTLAFHPNYETFRAFKSSFYFPLGLLIGINWWSEDSDVRVMIKLMLISAFVQSLRQLAYFLDYDPMAALESARTLRYFFAGMPIIFLVVQFTGYVPFRGWNIFGPIGIGLSLAALVAQQTRSMWIPQALFIVMAVYLETRDRGWISARRLLSRAVIVVAAGMAITVVVSALSERQTNLVEVFLHGHATDMTDSSGRWDAIKIESGEWLAGNPLLGRGLGFYTAPQYAQMEDVAWGHNGYLAYLSNLGVAGFMVFGVLVPLAYFRKLMARPVPEPHECGVMRIICLFFLFFMIVGAGLSTGVLGGQFSLFLGFFLGYGYRLGVTHVT